MKIQTLIEFFPTIQTLYQKKDNFSYIYSDSRKTSQDDIFCIYDNFSEKIFDYVQNTKSQIFLISKDNPFLPKMKNLKYQLLVSQEDPMELHGMIASWVLGNPSSKLKIIGVTGTNGKTSITNILYHLGIKQGFSCGLIGTICIKYNQKKITPDYTTPEPSSLNLLLDDMQKNHVEYVFIEASSHGLKLGRLNGINFLGGIFTNLTQDHLDFHKDWEDYICSKLSLFKKIEHTHNKFGLLHSSLKKKIKKFSEDFQKNSFLEYLGENEDFQISNLQSQFQGLKYRFLNRDKIYEISSNLMGQFNTENTAFSFACGLKLGWSSKKMLENLKKIPQIKGRFEVIEIKNRFSVVDYAHTPEALRNILQGIKNLNPKKLICICGCGGDRDKNKRPKMAKIATEYSDFVILTSDNPRTEDPNSILKDMLVGLPKDFKNFIVEVDRKKAIQKGVQMLHEREFLLVAGKGHEDYQIMDKKKIHFSDREEIEKSFLI